MNKLFYTAILGVSILASNPILAEKTNSSDSKQEKIVWGAGVSPFVRKVRMVLDYKKINYKLNQILPNVLTEKTGGTIDPEFADIKLSLGKIPAYTEIDKNGDKFSISESNVIVDYIEASNQKNHLRTSDPRENAKISWFMAYADNVLGAATYKIFFEKFVKPNVLKLETDSSIVDSTYNSELQKALDFLDNQLEGKKWIAGTNEMSLADIAVMSHMVSLIHSGYDLKEVAGSKRKNLQNFVEKMSKMKIVKDNLA